jgi:hypothetical protein
MSIQIPVPDAYCQKIQQLKKQTQTALQIDIIVESRKIRIPPISPVAILLEDELRTYFKDVIDFSYRWHMMAAWYKVCTFNVLP